MMSESNSSAQVLFDVVRDALRESELTFEENPEDGTIRFTMKSDNALLRMIFNVDQEKKVVSMYTTAPVTVPECSHVAVTILLNLLNQKHILSAFFLDTDDGTVVLRSGLDVEDGSLSNTMVQDMVHGCVCAYEMAFPKIMAVGFARMTPHEAMELGKQKSSAGEE
jgi:hypothetical protein